MEKASSGRGKRLCSMSFFNIWHSRSRALKTHCAGRFVSIFAKSSKIRNCMLLIGFGEGIQARPNPQMDAFSQFAKTLFACGTIRFVDLNFRSSAVQPPNCQPLSRSNMPIAKHCVSPKCYLLPLKFEPVRPTFNHTLVLSMWAVRIGPPMRKNLVATGIYAGHHDVQKWTMATLGDRWRPPPDVPAAPTLNTSDEHSLA